LSALTGEINGILAVRRRAHEVNVDGVEPMVSRDADEDEAARRRWSRRAIVARRHREKNALGRREDHFFLVRRWCRMWRRLHGDGAVIFAYLSDVEAKNQLERRQYALAV